MGLVGISPPLCVSLGRHNWDLLILAPFTPGISGGSRMLSCCGLPCDPSCSATRGVLRGVVEMRRQAGWVSAWPFVVNGSGNLRGCPAYAPDNCIGDDCHGLLHPELVRWQKELEQGPNCSGAVPIGLWENQRGGGSA